MRRAKCGGKCSVCGKKSESGLYWESFYKVLDFGPDAKGVSLLLEPTFEPVRCDDCETKQRQ